LRIAGEQIEDLENAKVLTQRLKPGDAFTLRAGGGGFGPPTGRDPEAVAHDVRQGYVSVEEAERIYLVALTPDRRCDAEQTKLLHDAQSGRREARPNRKADGSK
jgi:N-methylhydantoinase B